MARTTESAVQGVLMSDWDGSTDLDTPFIAAANLFVTRVRACASAKGITLSTDELEMIERYIAAHLYVMSDQNHASRTVNGVSETYQGQTGMRLEASKYGQTAMMLDPSGCAAGIGKGQRASMTWLGKAPSSQVDYIDRD